MVKSSEKIQIIDRVSLVHYDTFMTSTVTNQDEGKIVSEDSQEKVMVINLGELTPSNEDPVRELVTVEREAWQSLLAGKNLSHLKREIAEISQQYTNALLIAAHRLINSNKAKAKFLFRKSAHWTVKDTTRNIIYGSFLQFRFVYKPMQNKEIFIDTYTMDIIDPGQNTENTMHKHKTIAKLTLLCNEGDLSVIAFKWNELDKHSLSMKIPGLTPESPLTKFMNLTDFFNQNEFGDNPDTYYAIELSLLGTKNDCPEIKFVRGEPAWSVTYSFNPRKDRFSNTIFTQDYVKLMEALLHLIPTKMVE